MKWYGKFKSFLCVPTDKVLLIVLFRALVVNDRVSMATNFTKQVKNFVCNVFAVYFLVLRVSYDILEKVVFFNLVIIWGSVS